MGRQEIKWTQNSGSLHLLVVTNLSQWIWVVFMVIYQNYWKLQSTYWHTTQAYITTMNSSLLKRHETTFSVVLPRTVRECSGCLEERNLVPGSNIQYRTTHYIAQLKFKSQWIMAQWNLLYTNTKHIWKFRLTMKRKQNHNIISIMKIVFWNVTPRSLVNFTDDRRNMLLLLQVHSVTSQYTLFFSHRRGNIKPRLFLLLGAWGEKAKITLLKLQNYTK